MQKFCMFFVGKTDNYVYNKNMLMAALICMFVATVVLVVGVCFLKNNKTLAFLLQTFSLVSLLCLGFVAAVYKNNFSGYSIFIILSIAPQFLAVFDFKEFLNLKNVSQEELPLETKYNSFEDDGIENDSNIKKHKKHHFIKSNGSLFNSIGILLSSVCIGFCGLYLGIETFYGFLIGLALACSGIFLLLIVKKTLNPYDLLSYFLMFFGIGILLGQIATVLLYSLSLANILFAVGALIFAVYVSLKAFIKNRFVNIAYYLAMMCLICTLIV